VLTDMTTVVPEGLQAIRVDPSEFTPGYVRIDNPGSKWDFKACLVMAMIMQHPEEAIVVMDTDNVIHRNPVPDLKIFAARNEFMIGLDPGQRPIRHPDFKNPVIEESTSIMLVPPYSDAASAFYRQFWDRSTEQGHDLLEQRTWTLVATQIGRFLPKQFSWSKLWGMPVPQDVFIEHQHGPRKWWNCGADGKPPIGHPMHVP